jgi:tRNA (guanine-N7-)-methyltransferase
VGKNKLARWAELETFENVIQPAVGADSRVDHRIKGNWRKEIFRNDNPLVLELACGKGEYTVGMAILMPGCNFTGIDIKGARMWRGARTAHEKQLGNTAFLRTRIEFINSYFAQDEVNEIWITFPDPHTGKRNSNKRLTCPWFLNTYRNFLTDRGIIHLKTDNAELYSYTERLAADNGLEILVSTSDMHSMEPGLIPMSDAILSTMKDESVVGIKTAIRDVRTHYETMFMEKGLKINYLAFRLEKEKIIRNAW